MSIKKRVEKLEKQGGGGLQTIVMRQDLDDPALFTDGAGNEYREGANWPEGDGVTVLKVVFARNWRAEGEG